jgi:hypothetical protein
VVNGKIFTLGFRLDTALWQWQINLPIDFLLYVQFKQQ